MVCLKDHWPICSHHTHRLHEVRDRPSLAIQETLLCQILRSLEPCKELSELGLEGHCGREKNAGAKRPADLRGRVSAGLAIARAGNGRKAQGFQLGVPMSLLTSLAYFQLA